MPRTALYDATEPAKKRQVIQARKPREAFSGICSSCAGGRESPGRFWNSVERRNHSGTGIHLGNQV